ncbi:MAG: glycosyltransferase family 39 protein [Gammaproteobacteria bacterium]|nr:glycosyltransferase family 39 protein [Gammaproteobacteria bacterium]MBU1415517.1 glycosyltransferase family 39 protein [Gammaproteobacteria bacterium]
MSIRGRSGAVLVALFALAMIWFGTLDFRKLVKPDEGRYAEIAREMSLSGNWITPRLNGIKYFEKPPLQYWATAAAYDAFGANEWTARLWPALTGFLGILLAWFTGRRLFGPAAGVLAGATLASMLLYLAMAHFNTLDMGLAFFLEVAVFGFLLAQEGSRRWMLAAWTGLALAVLSKGIVALVLTGGTLVLYSLLGRDWSPWRRFEFLRGVPLFLLIAAPWFVAVSMANPEFPRFFFIHEHFERFLTTVHRRDEPAWFFVPILLLGALPWTAMALQGLAQAWPRRAMPEFQARRFLLLWSVVVFAFFSISHSKLPSYILPLFPALALLLGDFLNRVSRRALLAHMSSLAALALLCLILVPRIANRADAVTPADVMTRYGHWLTAAAAVWLGGTLVSILLAWRERKTAAVMTLAAASLLAGFGVLLGHDTFNRTMSSHYVASQVKPLLTARVPFYSVRMYEQTLPFYLDRTVTLVSYQDEFAFGIEHEPDKWIPTQEAFIQRWMADRDAFAIMNQGVYNELRQSELPMTEIARDPHRVIVRKPQP